ncbi:LuxR family transcriptional regulator [Streptomyces orinoci]|uniref:LuxR family transcriptional regulator n=1 Tax=Streptomyces orinoci TaxID=67339 RepID=A0ABV3JZM4_STRON|nr:LuxR family transcriptional regulator [Streptomyces orinoci]
MPGAIGPVVLGESVQAGPGPGGEAGADGRAPVELLTDPEAVIRRLTGLRGSATQEVCTLLTNGPWTAVLDAQGGAPHRIVLERAAVDAALGELSGCRARIVDRVPTGLLVADRRVALLALTPGPDQPAALMVRDGALLELLLELFEQVWRAGRALRPARANGPSGRAAGPTDGAVNGLLNGAAERPADGPDALDLQVLSLLLAGLTDASAAKQLGLGLRTVQRRVKRLMELAGVTTRLQLGWTAAERGWTTAMGQAADSSASRNRLRSSPPA